MSTAQGRFIWYELMTLDPQASRRFYEAVLEWKIEAQPSGPTGQAMDYRMIATPTGMVGGVFTLTAEMTAHGAVPCWLAYIGVDDMARSVAAVTAAGGRVLMPTQDIPGVGQIAMVADPQGAPFYVMQPQGTEPSTVFAPTQMGHATWNELHAANGPQATDFYCQQFGWSKPRALDMGPAGLYQIIGVGGQDAAGIFTDSQFPRPAWLVYFRVNSIEQAAKRVQEQGGQVTYGPMQVPGGDWVINALDPHGVMFALTGAP